MWKIVEFNSVCSNKAKWANKCKSSDWSLWTPVGCHPRNFPWISHFFLLPLCHVAIPIGGFKTPQPFEATNWPFIFNHWLMAFRFAACTKLTQLYLKACNFEYHIYIYICAYIYIYVCIYIYKCMCMCARVCVIPYEPIFHMYIYITRWVWIISLTNTWIKGMDRLWVQVREDTGFT